jgi:DNA-binding GntR family transcriptional regulator
MTTTATRAESVAALLRRAIQVGEYISGERLVELTLAQRLNVSQNTIRDALRILEGEGWVVKYARRGVYVRTYSPEEASELYTLWATLEALAMRWVIESLSKVDLGRLRYQVDTAQKHAQHGEMEESVEAIFGFHEMIARASGRAQTAVLLTSLRNQVRLLETLRQMRVPRNLPQMEMRLTGYTALLDAMERGDADAAQGGVRSLIMADCVTLLPLLDARR